jgi:hypothetical protein
MKLVDVDELINSLTVNQLDCPGCPEPEFLPELIEILKEAPEAELPIPGGMWERKWEDWRQQFSWLECSHCHAGVLEPYDYCPYCGSYNEGKVYGE